MVLDNLNAVGPSTLTSDDFIYYWDSGSRSWKYTTVSAFYTAIGGSAVDLASPGPIGGTTPAAGTFTTLTTSDLFTMMATGKDHVFSNDWSGNNVGIVWNKNSGGLSALRYGRADGKERAAMGYAELSLPFDGAFIETNSYLDGPVTAPATVQDITRPVIPFRLVTTGVINGDFAFYCRASYDSNGNYVVHRTKLNGTQTNNTPLCPVLEVGSYNSTGADCYLYNTFTDTSNYERAVWRWTSNVLTFGTNKLGTGSTRALQFVIGGTNICNFSTSGHLLWNTDATYDIGASGATRPRDIYSSTSVQTGGGVWSAQCIAGVSFGNSDANNFALIGSEASGRDLRLIKPGVAKMDAIIASTPARVQFTDTDNSSIVPLTVYIDGSGKVAIRNLNLSNLPTSSSGLSSGDVWSNSGVLTIV